MSLSVCEAIYDLAIEFQQQVIDAWESYGSSAENELRKAHRLLEQLNKVSHGALLPNKFPLQLLPLQMPFPLYYWLFYELDHNLIFCWSISIQQIYFDHSL